jgi:hypothetical protein
MTGSHFLCILGDGTTCTVEKWEKCLASTLTCLYRVIYHIVSFVQPLNRHASTVVPIRIIHNPIEQQLLSHKSTTFCEGLADIKDGVD